MKKDKEKTNNELREEIADLKEQVERVKLIQERNRLRYQIAHANPRGDLADSISYYVPHSWIRTGFTS